MPITPSTSVSPPVNVICKKESSTGGGGLTPLTYDHPHHHHNSHNNKHLLPTLGYNEKDQQSQHQQDHTNGSLSYNRLAAGNLTPLGSNSSVMTTPSPPMTPTVNTNSLPYTPNHDYNFHWHSGDYMKNYGHHASNYTSASNYAQSPYYGQMEYFNAVSGGQSMGPMGSYNAAVQPSGGYGSGNFGLSGVPSMGAAQGFSPSGLEYMASTGATDKYGMNMV